MRKLLAALVALVVTWCGTSWATIDWFTNNPGGGGNFTCASTSRTTARRFIGSDVGGLYRYDGSSSDWKRIGYFDDLNATNILCVLQSPIVGTASTPLKDVVLVGTRNGLFRSTDGGTAWTKVSYFGDGNPIYAMAWGSERTADSSTIVVGYRSGTSVVTSRSTDSGASWGFDQTVATDTTSVGAVGGLRMPIKIVLEHHTAETGDGNRDVYVLMGVNGDGGDRRELWRATNGGTSFTMIAPTDTHPRPIDITSEAQESLYKIAATDADDAHVTTNSVGSIWTYLGRTTNSWSKDATPTSGGTFFTGAVWTDGYYDYCLNVQKNCSSASAGLWRTSKGVTDSNSTNGWKRVSDPLGNSPSGTAWQQGWATTCDNAYGQTLSNVANSVRPWMFNDSPSIAQNILWVTASFASESFGELFTNHEYGSGPFQGHKLDNVNCAALAYNTADSTLWAGYYDIGLWRMPSPNQSSGGWTDMNPSTSVDTIWSGSDLQGGNVNSILIEGSNVYAIAAQSSKRTQQDQYASGGKVFRYNLYGSYGGSAFRRVPSAVKVDSMTDSYMRNIVRTSSHGYYFTLNGKLYNTPSSSDIGGTWSQVGSTTLGMGCGIMAVGAYASSNTVIAGGWYGLYRTTDGTTWTKTDNFGAAGPPGGMAGCMSDSDTNSTAAFQQEQWDGVHQILHAHDDVWYATVYAPNNACASGLKYGLLRSTDDGANWTSILSRRYARGVAVDSCDLERIGLTSGTAFSGGGNSDNSFTNSVGIEIVRYRASDATWTHEPQIPGGNSSLDWRYPFGDRIVSMPRQHTDDDMRYAVGSPGAGIFFGSPPSCLKSQGGGGCHEPCEMEGPNPGGGGNAVRRAREEGVAPKLPRTMFSIADAWALIKEGKLELYDVSGRKARTPSSGVYFVIERNKAGAVTARRAVLVTP